MQAVKQKIQDMNAVRKAKAEAKAEEKAEKDLAKARIEIAHEVRMAKEAEAEMELHVAKAGQKAQREIAKHANNQPTNATTARGDPHGAAAAPTNSAGMGAPPTNHLL